MATAAVGAVIGAYSHVLLDSLIYQDMHPWLPKTLVNGLLGAVSGQHVLLFCVVTGIMGVGILWQQARYRR